MTDVQNTVWLWWLSGSVSFTRTCLHGESYSFHTGEPRLLSLPQDMQTLCSSLTTCLTHSSSIAIFSFTLTLFWVISFASLSIHEHMTLICVPLLKCSLTESQWKTLRWSSPPYMFGSNPWRRRFKETRIWCSSWSLFCRWGRC